MGNLSPAAKADRFVLGIDASNIRAGGGVTHLQALLKAARPAEWGIDEVVVWGSRRTLDQLPDVPWLCKRHVPMLDRGLAARTIWQQIMLDRELRRVGACGLFSPGGLLPAMLHVPAVVMSQNLLPFAPREAARYRDDWKMRWRLHLLHLAQRSAFMRAAGVLFLTRYAAEAVVADLPSKPPHTAIVPHGLADRFFHAPEPERLRRMPSPDAPFRLLYVSIIDRYKHQPEVARAVAMLRAEGRPVTLELIGPAYPPALAELKATLQTIDPEGAFVRYHGPIQFEELHQAYREADAFAFASTCETISIIVLEAMAAGLPIACSARPPMPEVLGETGLYFEPEEPDSIAATLRTLLDQPEERARLAEAAFARSKAFSWERCARETFAFLAEVLNTHNEAPKVVK